ncbi:hypothetical protein, partial [Tautonia marina]|uniref:hypothetical protein n=1 Tax=Tautonia marina TaxID=2653855 RepID=UPI0013762A71
NHERRIVAAEREAASARQDAAEALAQATTAMATLPDDTNYISLVGYSRTQGLSLSHAVLAAHGRRIAAHCRAHDILIKDVPSEQWGAVHAYPRHILDAWFQDRD